MKRRLGKEIGKGSTVQLAYVADGAESAVTSTLAVLLSRLSGQIGRRGALECASQPSAPFVHQREVRGRNTARRLGAFGWLP